jgi:AcrR family transcriptional regulator
MVAARAEHADVRTRILEEATRLIAARGFDGTTVQDIADAVGVTKPAVLHHFPSKEHVREAVLGALIAHWGETLPRLLLAATASEDRFAAVFGELVRFFAADPNRARVVLREALDRPVETKKLLRSAVRPWLAAVAGYVESGQKSGRHWADVDAEAYVLHILQLVLAAAASAPVTSGGLLADEAHDARAARERYDRELARIAHASLFTVTEREGRPVSTNPKAAKKTPARARRKATR